MPRKEFKHTGNCMFCGNKIFSKPGDDYYFQLLAHILKEHAVITRQAKEMFRKRAAAKKREQKLPNYCKDLEAQSLTRSIHLTI